MCNPPQHDEDSNVRLQVFFLGRGGLGGFQSGIFDFILFHISILIFINH